MPAPQQVGMTLQQTFQPPRAKTLPFNGQDLPNQVIAELLKEASDSQQSSGLSERNAKTSETNAKTSETNSKTSETNSKTSETNSATSETNAYNYEITAATAALQTAMYLVAPMYLTEPLGRADAIARSVPTFMVQGDGVNVAAYEYRVIDAVTPATLIAQYAPSTTLGTEVEDTATNIASAASTINTLNKFKGKKVWDTTNKRLLRSSGTLSTSAWNVVDGSGTVTPI